MSVVCPNGHTSESQDYCDTCGAAIDLTAQPAPASSGASGAPDLDNDPDAASAPRVSHVQTCPNCATDNAPESLFCEACGYDFTTGAMPRGSGAAAGSPAGDPRMPAAPDPDAGAVGGPAAAGEPAAETAAETAAAGALTLEEPVAGPPDVAAQAGGIPEAVAPPTPGAPRAATPLAWVAEIWIDPDWYAVQEAEEPMPSPGLPTVAPLVGRSALVGRVSASRNIHPDVDCTTDSGVSRRHAQLTTDGSRWFVEDLGSANGTFVGGIDEPLPEDPIAVGPKRELEADDRIYLGAWTRIVVRRATDEEIAAASV